MDLKDIRVGNIFLSKKFNTPIALTVSDFAEAYKRADGAEENTWFEENLLEIPLTKETALKLGFVKRHDDYIKGDFVLRFNMRYLIINGHEYDYNGIYISIPNSVNKLQNLYLDFMREDLTFCS